MMELVLSAGMLVSLAITAVRAVRAPAPLPPVRREPDDFDAMLESEKVRAIYQGGVTRG